MSKGVISKDLKQDKKEVISFCPKSPNEALIWEHCPNNKATAMEIQRTLYILETHKL